MTACDVGIEKKDSPIAQKGVLDLSQWNFQKDGTVELNGEYVFYWKQLLGPDLPDPQELGRNISYIPVPDVWKGHKIDGIPATGSGYATYHLRIILPEPLQPLSLKVTELQTSANIFINGRVVHSIGKVGKTPETSRPGLSPKVIKFTPAGTLIDAVFQVSNYSHRRGGIPEKIVVGTQVQLEQAGLKVLAYNVFILGGILMIGLYHIGIYVLRRNERSPLYFGLFCILIAFRLLTSGERYLLEIIPGIGWELFYKLEYMTFFLAVPVFVKFIRSVFPDKFPRTVTDILTMIGIGFAAAVVPFPARVYTHTLNVFHAYTLILFTYGIVTLVAASIKKDARAIIFLAGFFVLFMATLNDILFSENIINTAYLVHYGLFIFIFSQAFLLSMLHAKSFDTIEQQQDSLIRTNTALEKEIQDRKQADADVRVARKSADIANNAKSDFLASMSHELRTPLNHIIGFTELLLGEYFGTLNKTQDEYMRDVHGSSKHLLSLINDILDLSKIESGKLKLELTEVPLREVLQNSALMFREKTIKHSIDLSIQLDDIPEHLVGDERKIKQIVYNLLANAIKFTPDGGKVLLIARACPMDGQFQEGVEITISDTGVGIHSDDLVRIFSPFEQGVRTTARRFQGTGLGLSLTKQLVDLHGGTIWAESSGESEGASLHVVIPQRQGL
jgi:two-component system, sensor histidine kinase